jgi:hypothetical protein
LWIKIAHTEVRRPISPHLFLYKYCWRCWCCWLR